MPAPYQTEWSRACGCRPSRSQGEKLSAVRPARVDAPYVHKISWCVRKDRSPSATSRSLRLRAQLRLAACRLQQRSKHASNAASRDGPEPGAPVESPPASRGDSRSDIAFRTSGSRTRRSEPASRSNAQAAGSRQPKVQIARWSNRREKSARERRGSREIREIQNAVGAIATSARGLPARSWHAPIDLVNRNVLRKTPRPDSCRDIPSSP